MAGSARNSEERKALIERFSKGTLPEMRAAAEYVENGGQPFSPEFDVPERIDEITLWPLVLKRLANIALHGVPKDAVAAAGFFAKTWGYEGGKKKAPTMTLDEQVAKAVEGAGGLQHEPDERGGIVDSEAVRA